MNTNLLAIVNRIVAEQGEGILADAKRLFPFFSDYAKNEYKEERVAFGRCIENGAYQELKKTRTADERQRVKATLADQVNTKTGIDRNRCADALDLLEAVVFKTGQQTTVPPPVPQYTAPPVPQYTAPPVQQYTAPPVQQYTAPPVQRGSFMIKKRGLAGLIILSILTLGFYALYWVYSIAKDVNLICEGDGKKTGGLLKYILLGIITFGIYNLIWVYALGDRLQDNGPRYNIAIKESGGAILLWMVIGSIIIVGPFIGLHIIIKNVNALADEYNKRIT